MMEQETLEFMEDVVQDKLGYSVTLDLNADETTITCEEPDPCYGSFGYGRGKTYNMTQVDVTARGFSFETCGAKVSGRLPDVWAGTFNYDEEGTLDHYDTDLIAVGIAIHKVCGPINYGEDCDIGRMMTPLHPLSLSKLVPTICGQR